MGEFDVQQKVKSYLLKEIGKAVKLVEEKDPILAKQVQKILWNAVGEAEGKMSIWLTSSEGVDKAIKHALYFHDATTPVSSVKF